MTVSRSQFVQEDLTNKTSNNHAASKPYCFYFSSSFLCLLGFVVSFLVPPSNSLSPLILVSSHIQPMVQHCQLQRPIHQQCYISTNPIHHNIRLGCLASLPLAGKAGERLGIQTYHNMHCTSKSANSCCISLSCL